MPSMPGIEMSVITRSGLRLSTSATSSPPSLASAITSTPSPIDSSALLPERTCAWSSARTTRTGRGAGLNFIVSSLSKHRADRHPGTRARADVQSTAGQFRPLAHAVQADVALGRGAAEQLPLVESHAVVDHQHADAVLRQEPQPYSHCSRVGVTYSVVQRLLDQAQRDGSRVADRRGLLTARAE